MLRKSEKYFSTDIQINVATEHPTCFTVNKLHPANTVPSFVFCDSQNKFRSLKVQLSTLRVVCLKYHFMLLESPKLFRPLWGKQLQETHVAHVSP